MASAPRAWRAPRGQPSRSSSGFASGRVRRPLAAVMGASLSSSLSELKAAMLLLLLPPPPCARGSEAERPRPARRRCRGSRPRAGGQRAGGVRAGRDRRQTHRALRRPPLPWAAPRTCRSSWLGRCPCPYLPRRGPMGVEVIGPERPAHRRRRPLPVIGLGRWRPRGRPAGAAAQTEGIPPHRSPWGPLSPREESRAPCMGHLPSNWWRPETHWSGPLCPGHSRWTRACCLALRGLSSSAARPMSPQDRVSSQRLLHS